MKESQSDDDIAEVGYVQSCELTGSTDVDATRNKNLAASERRS
jgi:hypothetical protein